MRPRTLDECLALLAEHQERAKVIAGGQSLLPLMALRMAQPDVLVDLAQIDDLAGYSLTSEKVILGALTVHRELTTPEIAAAVPVLPMAAEHIAHLAIRNRGTMGGSLAHADPAAELPAVAMLLGASIHCVRPGGSRTVPAAEFFLGPYTTALHDDELIQRIVLPLAPTGARFGFVELAPRDGDYARAGAVCRIVVEPGNTIASVDAVLFAVGPAPHDVSHSLGPARGMRLDEVDWRALSATAIQDLPAPIDDDAADRYDLGAVMLRRALQHAARERRWSPGRGSR